jgi:tetratricopeptide (TPR) repeat protein
MMDSIKTALVVSLCVLIAPAAWAQADTDVDVEEVAEAEEVEEVEDRDLAAYKAMLEAANASYNASEYDEAARGFVAAIQERPQRPVPYRNLARTHFWQGEYTEAVAYYDMYLRLAREADDVEQVQSERRLASSRAGGEPWTAPESQQMALKALEDQLQDGPAYTRGAGGAWGLYQTLLRTGFARPELSRLRRRLVARLLDEFEGILVPQANQPTPRLDLQDWQLQKERLEAASTLTRDESLAGIIGRRMMVVEAALALLNNRQPAAVELSRGAVEDNPDMVFLRWLVVSALVDADRHQEALDELDELAERLADAAPAQIGYVDILRASILQRMERDEEAADLYLRLLSATGE